MIFAQNVSLSSIIVQTLDRLGRQNPFLLTNLIYRTVVENGIEVVSWGDGMVINKNNLEELGPQLALFTNAAIGHSENTRKTGKIREAVTTLIGEAVKGAKVNLGYWQPAWIDFVGEKKCTGTFRLNAKANMVKQVVYDYLDGHSMFAIAQELNGNNVPPLSHGKCWSQGTIHYLLGSESLLGTLTIKGQRLEGYYPALISKSDWQMLQSKLAQNKNRKGGSKSDNIVNLFRNRVKCASCGGSVLVSNTNRGAKSYYMCSNARYHKGCHCHRGVAVRLIEEDFFMDIMGEQPASLLDQQTIDHQKKAAQIQSGIAKHNKVIADLTELIGTMPLDQLKVKLAKEQSSLQLLTESLDTVNREMVNASHIPAALADLKDILADFEDACDTEDEPLMTGVLDMAVKQLEKSLADKEIRKKLLNLLPTLVNKLVIDFDKPAFKVVRHNGESEWIDIMRDTDKFRFVDQ